jgi:hypothetical protein
MAGKDSPTSGDVSLDKHDNAGVCPNEFRILLAEACELVAKESSLGVYGIVVSASLNLGG